jgi:antitoxin VapB
MGVHFLTEEIENLARDIAHATGESLPDVYLRALLERKERLSGAELTPEGREAKKLAFFAKLDARPRTQDPRDWREIEREELYDEFGQPIG